MSGRSEAPCAARPVQANTGSGTETVKAPPAAAGQAKTVGTNNLLRYLVLVIVMFVLIYTDFANPIFMFCGYMGMKVSAYLNPWLCKIRSKVIKI